MEENKNRKVIRETSGDVLLLEQVFAKKNVGEIVTDKDVFSCIARSVKKYPWIPQSVIRRQLSNGRVWERVRNVGWKLCNESEIVIVSSGEVRRIHRSARRGLKKLRCSEYEKLDKAEKVTYNTSATILALTEMTTSSSKLKRLSDEVRVANSQLPSAKVLDHFSGKGES